MQKKPQNVIEQAPPPLLYFLCKLWVCIRGEATPLHSVYGKNLYTFWTEEGIAGALYSVSESGWMEKANFWTGLRSCFLHPFGTFLHMYASVYNDVLLFSFQRSLCVRLVRKWKMGMLGS